MSVTKEARPIGIAVGAPGYGVPGIHSADARFHNHLMLVLGGGTQ